MIRTYFQMLVDEIALEEAAEAARAAAIIATARSHGDDKPPRDAVGKMKQFASWFTHGVPGGAALRKAIFEARSGPAVLAAVESFFAQPRQQPRAGSPPTEASPIFSDACG